MILMLLLGIALTSWLIWLSSEWISRGAEYLGRGWNPGIRGATISAISSSLPELFVALIFLNVLSDVEGFVGGLSTMTGSAIFNILLIPSLMGFVALTAQKTKKSVVSSRVILRDGSWLIGIQIIILGLLWRGVFGAIEASGLLLYYALYMRRLVTSNKGRNLDVLKSRELQLKVIRMIGAGVLVLGVSCFVLVEGCVRISQLAGWSLSATALIVAAAATSLPDTFISLRDCVKGASVEGVSNAIGSNIFDLCVALGLPVLIYSLMYGQIQLDPTTQEMLIRLWFFMMGVTVIACSVLYFGKRLTWFGTIALMVLYLGFVGSVFAGVW